MRTRTREMYRLITITMKYRRVGIGKANKINLGKVRPAITDKVRPATIDKASQVITEKVKQVTTKVKRMKIEEKTLLKVKEILSLFQNLIRSIKKIIPIILTSIAMEKNHLIRVHVEDKKIMATDKKKNKNINKIMSEVGPT